MTLERALTVGALAPLARYPQFILYKTVPSQSKPGKLDKLPVNWQTGQVANAHDPAIQTDYRTAIAAAGLMGPSYGVGFVFTPNDPFWFLDIDNCLMPDGSWSPIATQLLQAFAGAAVEVSISGKGLHVFGTGAVPQHGCKNTLYGLEFYHTDRFVALSGDRAGGNAATAHDAALAWLVQYYFPFGSATGEPVEWTDLQVPEAEDADLLRRMLASGSAGAAFGNRATFADLWDANVDALSRAYPDNYGGRPYDASSADAALAQHLAFWARKDCARMLRLMQQSKLKRDKWDREDYLPRTIVSAVSRQTDVLAEREPVTPPVSAATASPVVSAAPRGTEGPAITYLSPAEQLNFFHGCIYIGSLNKVLCPGGQLYGREQFDVLYGGYAYGLDAANSKTAKGAWDAFTKSQACRFPKANGLCFRPELPPATVVYIAESSYANLWWPVVTPSEPGDVTPFTDHLRKLLPNDRDRMIMSSYLAALVQFPGDKFQWWPVIQGCEGNGKTLLLACAEAAIGARYCHRPSAKDLVGSGSTFNAWMAGKILIGIEEIKVGHRLELIEILKDFVTNDRKEVQGKGADQVMADNRANGILFTNHKDGMPQKSHGRRYATFYTPQQSPEDLIRDGMHGDYFPKLYGWLKAGGFAHVTHWLKTFPIPAEFNPAMNNGGQLHRAPVTSSTPEALSVGLGSVEQEVLDAVGRGEPGFCGGWISSVMLTQLIRHIGRGMHLTPHKQHDMLAAMGYIPHPNLPNGRTNAVVSPDGKKPILYVKAGHVSINETRPAELCKMYVSAQIPPVFNTMPATVTGIVPAAPT